MNAFLFDMELSAPDLAKKIKVSRVTVWRIKERGTAKPSFIKLLRKYKLRPDPYIGIRV